MTKGWHNQNNRNGQQRRGRPVKAGPANRFKLEVGATGADGKAIEASATSAALLHRMLQGADSFTVRVRDSALDETDELAIVRERTYTRRAGGAEFESQFNDALLIHRNYHEALKDGFYWCMKALRARLEDMDELSAVRKSQEMTVAIAIMLMIEPSFRPPKHEQEAM